MGWLAMGPIRRPPAKKGTPTPRPLPHRVHPAVDSIGNDPDGRTAQGDNRLFRYPGLGLHERVGEFALSSARSFTLFAKFNGASTVNVLSMITDLRSYPGS